MPFEGFTRDTFDFFMNLRFNNEKAWFHEHKQQYQQVVRAPFLALHEAIAPTVRSIDPQLETRAERVLARIYRDTRFSKDKSPYRDHLWLSYRPPQTPVGDSYGFFFELGPDTLRYGFGFYTVSRERMDALRKKLLVQPDVFFDMLDKTRVLDTFDLAGDMYKRPLVKDLPQRIAPWYNRKFIDLIHQEATGKQAMSAQLAQDICLAFQQGAELYHYIKSA